MFWTRIGVLDAIIAGNNYNELLGNMSSGSLVMTNSLKPVNMFQTTRIVPAPQKCVFSC